MSEPTMFEICFPSHITRIPVCRPGETIAGVVVLKLNSPIVASHLLLQFSGAERVRRVPVAVRTEQTEKKQQQTTMSHKMVMEKEFFRRKLVLWGEPKQTSMRIIPCDSVHRFHFSFTMPYVNMPTPRQTPDIEISYSLEASLFSEVFDQQQGVKVLRDIHKTSAKCFRFEPVVQQYVGYGTTSSMPYSTSVSMKDAGSPSSSPTTETSNRTPQSGLPSISLLPFHSSKKTFMDISVFHPTSAYLPGETIDLLLLAPAGKKITNATFQLRENVRCRKSSAPIIDESDVPLLWKYSVDLSPPREFTFSKLSKTNVTQDIGMLGRFVFTGQQQQPGGPQGIPGDLDSPSLGSPSVQSQAVYNASDSSSVSTSGQDANGMRIKSDEGLAISNIRASGGAQGQRIGVHLSPLTETQEIGARNSSTTLGASSDTSCIDDKDPSNQITTQAPPLSVRQVRSRNGSLGTAHTQQLYSQNYSGSSQTSSARPRSRQMMSVNASTPYHSSAAVNSRTSKSISASETDDNVSDRSSISDTLSIRYQPAKTSMANNFSLTRGASTNSVSKYNASVRAGFTPVSLGGLLTKGSYKFAKIQLTLPSATEISPVSSVFLDFEYTVDISMTIGGSFGTTKRAVGRLPLRIVTMRTAVKTGGSGSGVGDRRSQTLTDPTGSLQSLRDSMSCLNLSIAHSDETPGGLQANSSPANTLTELHFETSRTAAKDDAKLTDGCYPCLLSYIQNGDRIPMPELEAINIGSNLM
ncbi:hypothetical protein COEREDRAFT_82893 [Coemansia reversa NRRL 1564]|uniref:Arrestin-like N-terminal domain-containing protein n=1 Tax=Coemansia reversa (strain ATCC 12441 / NRRL 1564) TaxID=763665 RepID=A0A2G5B5F3_COERN|nr:hypothetical protein COEREDRAFT_82893 [Coemansia reversa NRRL 1564]|eukprot:PIA14220.1 hypothetical protein COEREDRAFT_82893 [Coemansia reversa NRRL 1564]